MTPAGSWSWASMRPRRRRLRRSAHSWRPAALEIDRRNYRRQFGPDALSDFAGAFAALRDDGLVVVGADAVRPTSRAMFYADSIAALFAWRQVQANRNARPRPSGNDNGRGYM